MAKTLTWLHISDIHFGDAKDWMYKEARTALIDKLADGFRTNSYPLPDCIFCTGDIAFGGTSEKMKQHYKDAADFFDLLLKVCGNLPVSRLYVVPGNHDVNRKKIDKVAQKGWLVMAEPAKAKSYINDVNEFFQESKREFKNAVKRLDEYADFINTYLPHLKDENGRHSYILKNTINNISIGIVGINSAWSCAGKTDDRALWLPWWQVYSAVRAINETDIRIALIHHPLDWFNAEDRTWSDLNFSKHFDFLLHGHTHTPGVKPSQQLTTIGAGAIGTDNNTEFGVNLTQIILDDSAKSHGKSFMLHHKTGDRLWKPFVDDTHAINGVWDFEIPSRVIDRIYPGKRQSFSKLKDSSPEKIGISRAFQGFRSIKFPKDLILDRDSEYNIVVIGLNMDHFSKDIHEKIFSNKDINKTIYINDEPDIAKIRQSSLEWKTPDELYLKLNKNHMYEFQKVYNVDYNFRFRRYTLMPFGLYCQFANYVYYIPLWGKDGEHSAIDQWGFEAKIDTPFGQHLLYQFNNIMLNSSTY